MNLKKIVLGALATIALVGCGTTSQNKSESSSENKIVKVGLYGEKNEAWDYLKPILKEKENIDLEFYNFTDYVTPNTAADEGSVDINAFQTIAYMDKFNEEKGTKLVSIGWTILQPLGIYSNKIQNVSELKQGDIVVIPNGSSNGGRALRLLQATGVIKVDPSKGVLPTIADITENKLNLTFKEVDAAQTIRSLDDVTIAIANGDVALDSGKSPKTDAIFLESVNDDSKPYYNVIATNEKNKDNQLYQTVVKYFQTDEVAKVIEDTSKGASIPIWKVEK